MIGRALRRAAPLAVCLLAGSGSAGHAAHRSCCYTNPQYAGVCQVRPAKGETCDSILAYLNNPSAMGKTYCSSTAVRVGWELVACVAKKPADRATAAVPPGP